MSSKVIDLVKLYNYLMGSDDPLDELVLTGIQLTLESLEIRVEGIEPTWEVKH